MYLGQPSPTKFPKNEVKNTKYNAVTFVPKVLYEQFKVSSETIIWRWRRSNIAVLVDVLSVVFYLRNYSAMGYFYKIKDTELQAIKCP